jgi:ABC-2 type transport system ATP-binding protein
MEGTVTVLGVGAVERPMLVRRMIGYVPQLLSADAALTGQENVELFARLFDVPRRVRRQRVDGALSAMGLTDAAQRLVKTYSGGMIRRLELAQALVNAPSLLVLDEPTVGLDPEQRLRFREMISHAGEGRTVVMSSHQTEDITALCTRIAVIHQGRARFTGTPAELTAQAAGRVWTDTQRSPAALATWRTGEGAYRNVGDPPAGADLIPPTLEDAYLLLMAEPEREVTRS